MATLFLKNIMPVTIYIAIYINKFDRLQENLDFIIKTLLYFLNLNFWVSNFNNNCARLTSVLAFTSKLLVDVLAGLAVVKDLADGDAKTRKNNLYILYCSYICK